MMILCFACAFALGVCLCVSIYIFVILPCINENYKEFNYYIEKINYLADKDKRNFETINFQRKQLRQLQNAYNKLKNNKNVIDK